MKRCLATVLACLIVGLNGCAQSNNPSAKLDAMRTTSVAAYDLPTTGDVHGGFGWTSGTGVSPIHKRDMFDRLFLQPPEQPRIQFQGLAHDLDGDGDELLVIARDKNRADAMNTALGAGGMVAKLGAEQKQIAIPLKHTDVHGSIAGYIATVEVKQQYQNPYDQKIEAVYVFPLPDDAAVNDFVMTIGDRHIRGIIREKEEAQKIYNEAKSQGYVASLMTQDRPNIFTQSVANIEPGKAIDVDIKYFHTLSYSDGWYEFVFPMVVGPRFNPPTSSEKSPDVKYLRPTERSGHDIALSLDIDAGVAIEKLESINHAIDSKEISPTRTQVAIKSSDSIPNKDFVLRYKVAGERVKTAMLVQRDTKNPEAGYFTLMIFPPDSLKDLPRKPLEMVYTIDVSGSMAGQPIDQAKNAVRYALTHMQHGDSFQIVQFDTCASQMSDRPLDANEENVSRGLHYLDRMQGGGGTMMLEGMRNSLNFSHDPHRMRFVTFLTDGFIGNEPEILGAMHEWLGETRVFSMGVGASTNRYLLDSMAKMGNGSAAFLSLNDDAGRVMAEHFARISHPALTDVHVDFGAMNVSEIYPQRLPDLFVGAPVVITGKFSGHSEAKVKVTGNVGGEVRSFEIPVSLDAGDATKTGIASVWARQKIGDISDRAVYDPDAMTVAPEQIRTVALEYGLMSQFTSFIAVDSSQKTAGDHGTTVQVPVPVPEGVRYETTVGEK